MRIILLNGCFFLCLLYSSCSKSSSQISYNSVYHKNGIEAISDLMLFTDQGQVKDIVAINRYVAMDSFTFSYYSDYINKATDLLDNIQFPDPLHAKILRGNEWANYDLSDQFPRFILTRKDTTVGTSGGDLYSRSLEYWICQYKPDLYQEWLVSSTRGSYVFGYSTREKFVFKLSGNQLCAQIIVFIKHKPYSYGEYVNNFMDDKFFVNLSAGDTISLKFYSLKYEH